MREFKLVIPFPGGSAEDAARGHGFHGILRVNDAAENAPLPEDGSVQGRPLAVFTHGLLSHKNALFFRPMAGLVGMDSFRGEGDSPGEWKAGSYERGVEELRHVVEHMVQRFGYKVDLLVAHSKGCAVTHAYVAQHCSSHARSTKHRPPSRMLMCSGRLRMELVHRKDEEFQPQFDRQGYASIHVPIRGTIKEFRVYPDDHESQCNFPTRSFVERVPPSVQVVPVFDAPEIANLLTAHPYRSPGSVHVELIENGDHNFRGAAGTVLLEKAGAWLQRTAQAAQLPTPSVPVPLTAKKRGSLIVVEGLDRAGKSTQVERLVERLGARYVKFPERSTNIGQMINAYLQQKEDVNDHSVHLLFSANRWELMTSILASLGRGETVVCDRYAFSGIAYSRAKGLDWRWCIAPDVGLPLPDLTLFLDLDEATAERRAAYGEERYEKRAFQRLVREAFDGVETLMTAAGARWERIDASGTPDDVTRLIATHVARALVDAPGPLTALAIESIGPAFAMLLDSSSTNQASL